MKVLIKGAGDLATGIAYRLYQAGYDILMTEIPIPTTVRRIVAFSRVVYEKEAVIEGVRGVLVHTIEEVKKAHREGAVPVIVDEKADIGDIYAPEVVIDAIIAKENLGTTIEEAPLVIGVGPGFTAGKDCHGVIETMRGHYLGKVIREGSAIPNTGVPGNIGGYTIERIIRASADGEFLPVADIGDLVEKDQVVAMSGGQPIYALMPGIVRGMLQAGVKVKKGMKCGDIDALCERNHCFTISDKARSIGGGVLEAVVGYEHGKF
ncbi:selenium-dependent molybdenum cofactor biosynthesis protein YqeB [Anaerocolumna aminovalerica]|uniref:selenium-dependent molybdenum cofactor biosynthesis protein YqeB n=1 Tax=Anaerocolumna aminovalerica TaxID=1527 RepID=UPI00248C974B|nr:selenium-dependent molybdenum cofactor biosynthesis protein YqeB [Anaerocolumna aminovalerica]